METKVQRGYLVLADLSGYTRFMAGTELEHAHEICGEVLDLVVHRLTPALSLAEVEGDAVFAYAPEVRIPRGEMLLELIEDAYVAFRDQLAAMQRHTTCTCRACRAIPTLDLKFVVHAGEYALQQVAGRQKPVGSAVNLVHRLLKNTVGEHAGWRAYVLFSEAALDRMGIRPEGVHASTEHYEHLGAVEAFSLDLHERHRALTEARRVYLAPEEADVSLTHDFPAPPAVVWDWLHDPGKRSLWMEGTRWSTVERPKGRLGPGAVNHCAHGSGTSTERILDWRPFRYFTCEHENGPFRFRMTEELEPTGDGTRLRGTFRLEMPLPRWMLRPIGRFLFTKAFDMRESWRTMDRLMAQEEPAEG